MLLIHTHKATNRVRYIFELFFNNLLGLEYEITTKKKEFLSYSGPKFSYLNQPLDDELFFAASGLLFEHGIGRQELSYMEYEGSAAFFPANHKDSSLPFDPFAAGFYLVSRYEEYLPYVKDEHSRFSPQNSFACEKGFLQEPLVNKWAIAIGDILKKRYRGFSLPEKKYSFVPTIDIDSAWAYKYKGMVRSLGGHFRSLSNFDFSGFANRTRVLLGLSKDPFDTYETQLGVHLKYDLRPIYFILFADYGQNDKNIHIQNRNFQVLIKSLADYSEVGIHSSFGSSFDSDRLRMELDRLSKVLNREVNKVRQHFIRLNLPVTYRNFTDLGIQDDYSMGYLSRPGFRAGICDTFNFYDLDLDAATNLRIHPFAFAETASQDKSPEERLASYKYIIQKVKEVNGTLIGAWDNESLSNFNQSLNWRMLYEKVIKMAVE